MSADTGIHKKDSHEKKLPFAGIPVSARSEWAQGPKSFEALDTSELIRNLDKQGPRAEILRRVSVNATPIRNAIKESGLSVRKNADLDGYRSYETNIKQLRDAIVAIAMAQNPHTADDAEKVFKILNRIEAHHKRVTEDIQKKFALGQRAPRGMSGTAVVSMSGEKTEKIKVTSESSSDVKTPESFSDIKKNLDTYNARIRDAARGNPAAIITAKNSKYTLLYQPLLKATLDEYKKLHELAVNGADPQPERMHVLGENLAKLDAMSVDIADYLSGKTSTVLASSDAKKPETEAEKNERINKELKGANPDVVLKNPDSLEKRTAFREQWLHKSEGAGVEYKKTKGDVQQMLEGYYTEGFFKRNGAKVRAMFGLKPKGLDKERQGKLDAADTAAGAYAASLRERYIARLDRRGIVSGARETAIAQFDALCANRFVIQSGTMLHEAQNGTLLGAQDGAWKRSVKWYGGLSKGKKIALGAAMTAGAAAMSGGLAAAATLGIGTRIAWKSIMIGTGIGALLGRTVNQSVTKDARENVSATVRDVQATYTPEVRSEQREELVQALRRRDRASTVGNVAGVATGAFIGASMVPVVDAFAEGSLPHFEPTKPSISKTDSQLPNNPEQTTPSIPNTDAQLPNNIEPTKPALPKIDAQVPSSDALPPNIDDVKRELENIPRTQKEIIARLPEDGFGPRVGNTPEITKDASSIEHTEDSEHTDDTDGTEILDADWYGTQKGDTLWDITHKNLAGVLKESEAEKFLEYLYNHGTGAMRGDSAEAVTLRERIGWNRSDNNIDVIHYKGDGSEVTKVNINGLREIAKEWASHKLSGASGAPSSVDTVVPREVVPGSHIETEDRDDGFKTKTYGERVEEFARKTVDEQPKFSGTENNLQGTGKKIFGIMMENETPSVNVEDRTSGGAAPRVDSDTLRTPDNAEPIPAPHETSKVARDAGAPSTESILTPEAGVAGGLAGAASYKTPERGVSLEVTPKEIKAEKRAILLAFGEQPPRFFNFGPTDGPYAALKKMTIEDVEKVLLGSPSEYMRFTREAGLSNDRTNKLPLWAEYFKIWRALPIPENEKGTYDPTMKFDTYLDGIARHSVVTGRHAS